MCFIEVDLFVELPTFKNDRLELDLCLCGLYDIDCTNEYRYELKNGWVFIADPINGDQVNEYIANRIIDMAECFHTNYYRNVTVSCKKTTEE